MNDKFEFTNSFDDREFGNGHPSGDGATLEALFGSARESMPELCADNFTKVVINSLPESPVRRKASGVSFELIGVLLGLVVAYFMIDFNSLASGFLSLVAQAPQSVTVAPIHLLVALGSICVMSVGAWWAVEQSR